MSSSCVGVLLAGGAARRLGGHPKGLARLGGVRIADLALAALRGATTSQLVVANDPRAAAWFPGLRIVADEVRDVGPLAGLATALTAAAGASVLVVAWDMPYVTAELLAELRRRGERGASAVVPVHGAARQPEPLCAWYGPEALAPCLALLERGERRAAAMLETLPGAEVLGEGALARFGSPTRLFTSVDTRDALAALGGTVDPSAG
ncbi:MAG: molybdenum cofactor guanylyltransferase [Gemmatimonadaceae bacterium]|nr:molybdenum cofactor guanylyltransferase [Gemmatimonadaceae bacterium]NUP72241.1 molybdenum cofactor guanylyltransferase [Gemmatimonadaceae bacterium]NUS32171.1 molybdenum cofactor guanylyltransferase [Gemmatimonadaceae bacterium]NUS47242.1 molybdenum cofactor guanylyltransferase [Gemmatimonadaceae bacterium]